MMMDLPKGGHFFPLQLAASAVAPFVQNYLLSPHSCPHICSKMMADRPDPKNSAVSKQLLRSKLSNFETLHGFLEAICSKLYVKRAV